MQIGIPRESHAGETRVAATPQTVGALLTLGYSVVVEPGAGDASSFSDAAYVEAGADVGDPWAAQVVLKVNAPDDAEITALADHATLVSLISPALNPEMVDKLSARPVTVLAMDAVPRISRAQSMDVLSSMANIAGYRAVVEAAHRFGRFFTGQVTAAGKVPPAKVLVVGAGVAGLAAIGAAGSMGAIVRATGYGPVRILLPMISSREEVLTARKLLKRVERDLRSEGHEIADFIPLGAMIEVPAAAIALPGFIGAVDFISIGTNDLVQYLLAADRNNEALGELYSPLHPSLVRLLHDVILTFGLIVLFKLEFSLNMVAAVLTVIGYSMNDTVVVFDRLRENLRKYKTMPLRDVIDLSLNETLSRTIITGVTAVMVLAALAIFGGEALFGFSIALMFGIIIGTYSSIYVAKNIVAAGLAKRCEIQVSYAIGVAEPTSISVETFGTGKVAEALLVKLVREFFELRPYGLIEMLDLKRPIYQATAAYGHFGRDEFPWEKTDKAELLRAAAGL